MRQDGGCVLRRNDFLSEVPCQRGPTFVSVLPRTEMHTHTHTQAVMIRRLLRFISLSCRSLRQQAAEGSVGLS